IAWLVAGRVVAEGSLRQMVTLQLGLSVALVPLTLWFFGGASWVAPLANLVAIPAAAVLLPLLVGAVAIALAIPDFGVPLLRAMSWAWWALYRALEWLAASAPHAWLTTGAGGAVLLLAMVGVVLLVAPRGLPVRPLAFAFLLPLFLPRQAALPTGHFRLAVLDVGQGLSAVVQTRRHALLFDAGPAWPSGLDMGEAVVAPYLRWRGVRRLDAMIISHRDMDHRGGAGAVMKALAVDRVLGSDGTGAEPCVAGQAWQWDGVSFEIFNPPRDGRGSSNDRGCVLRIATGSTAALLPADIGRASEQRLVRDYGARLAAQVLVSPHHGSAGSSSAAFVAEVHPELVIHPAGWKNQFGFPRAEPVARYARIGARQVQTGEWGMVDVEAGPRGIIRAAAWRQRRPRLWQLRPGTAPELGGAPTLEGQSRVGLGASP
ncbi:MAG TPA: DNA internalization-related competence protein ComEC/Rec2, partial [Nevskiaceae bacterium]